LRAGRKETHWIWFVFPQVAGLGGSPMSTRYAISSLREARAYLRHPVLGPRLLECAAAVAGLARAGAGLTADQVLGELDALKLRSSMTLFHRADPDEAIFARVLADWFGGVTDPATDRRL